MDPWYKVATPRKEVREGRSFNPDEFAIHLEQVIAQTAPEDYRDPQQFFSRTCFTRALREHTGMVLRRLAGETAHTAPVLTLITQFGGGKTHTLTALYHMAFNGDRAAKYPGVANLIREAGISTVPRARVAVFVGNAWDPQEGRETPWIDVAWQLAGEKGVKELGPAAKSTPPGTEALSRVFQAAEAPVLVLFDEVLNFLNRHRGLAEHFHAFIQNLTIAMTGTTHGVAVISLPRSQVEMTDWDLAWQERITRVVRRVAKDLIANDEAEISEVVRRRLFEDIGPEKVRQKIAKSFADWCFERRAQLPPEWTAVDSALTESKAREYLRQRFEVCYPFHPATLSVFQRKWQSLPQYQQTRGTLAMLAQWIAWAYRTCFTEARREPLITLGSAPLEVAEFRAVVLGQLGEPKLDTAIDTDIAGEKSHARALDADTKGTLRDIHRRVGTTIFFESSGGQIDKVAHLPELRFALGEPGIDTTSIDNAAMALENKAFYIRRIGTDGFMISSKANIKQVVNQRRASLDEDSEVKPAMRDLIKREFERGASLPLILFPEDGSEVPDTPKLTLIILDPEDEWGNSTCRQRLADWTKQRGKTPRLYPGALVWCGKKPGRDLREKVEVWLAWKRVDKEAKEGTLRGDFDRANLAEIKTKMEEAEGIAKDEVWGGYRYVILADNQEPDGLKVIDLGAGHSSSSETLTGRIIAALKSQGLLNESVGASYLERNWPPALKEVGAWPLSSLRQSFLNGSLTRLLDPDTTLRTKIVDFVAKGDFGLASGQKPDGGYERVFFNENIDSIEIAFEPDVFLLLKNKAKALKGTAGPETVDDVPKPSPIPGTEDVTVTGPKPGPEPPPGVSRKVFRISGNMPAEVWNRFGTKMLPKLRTGADLKITIDISVSVNSNNAQTFEQELKQIIEDLGLIQRINII